MLRKIILTFVSIILMAYVIWEVDIANISSVYVDVSPVLFLKILVLIGLNVAIISWRLQRILGHFGVDLSFVTAFCANVSGLLASLVMINLVGSVLGRQVVLRHAGVNPSAVAMVSGYEKIVLISVGGALFILGAFALLGTAGLGEIMQTIPVGFIALAIGSSSILAVLWSRSPLELGLLDRLRSKKNLLRFSEVAAVTFVAQAFMLGTYVVAIVDFGYDQDLWKFFAAAAIVSFAASLPISVNGWGIREVVSVFAFGAVGVPASKAVAVSILIGISSTLVVLVVAPIVVFGRRVAAPCAARISSDPTSTDAPYEQQKIFAIIAAFALGILLLFQVPISAAGATVTVNMADPFAFVALGLVVSMLLMHRQWPFSVPTLFLWWMLGLSILVFLSFAIGATQFGVTPWALKNRVGGWFVLMGYLVCGATIAGQLGEHGRRRLVQILAVAIACIVVLNLVHIFAFHLKFVSLLPPHDLEGFSANRNTFAFQILMVIGFYYAYVISLRSIGFRHIGLLGLLILGIIATSSLTGLVGLAVLSMFLLAAYPKLWKRGAAAIIIGILLYGIILLVNANMGVPIGGKLGGGGDYGISAHAISKPSVNVRWMSIIEGFSLWWSNPVFGAGLGAFMFQRVTDDGRPLVIYSTYIWILAEMGLVGILGVMWYPVKCFKPWLNRLRANNKALKLSRGDAALIAVLLVFGVFSLTHEVAYQRIFWLVLGALMAVPADARKAGRA